MNKSGRFRYKATKVSADSALAQIIKLVQEQPGKDASDKVPGPSATAPQPI